jgi:hypothetical protein
MSYQADAALKELIRIRGEDMSYQADAALKDLALGWLIRIRGEKVDQDTLIKALKDIEDSPELVEDIDLALWELDEDEGRNDAFCLDCGMMLIPWNEPCEYFMVHDHVWTSVAGKYDGMLCVGCLESRLGRELTTEDFTDAPINSMTKWDTPRLTARKQAA